MKNKNHLFLSKLSNGFSLVEIAVGLGLLSIIALILSQLMVKQSDNSSQITDFYEFNEFTIRMGDMFRNSRACENTLRGFALPAAGALDLAKVRNADSTLDLDGKPGAIMFDMANVQDTTLSPRARVRSIKINAYNNNPATSIFSSDANLFRGQIEITFERGPAGNPNNLTYFRTIPILVKNDNSDPTKIFTCYNEENAWNAQLCQGLLSGRYTEKTAATERLCEDINIKGSVSTDGHFCFNKVDPTKPSAAGDIHQKDCANSWLAGWAQNYGGESCYVEKANTICKPNFVIAGVTLTACGKRCVKSELMCCRMRLQKTTP